MGDGALNLFQVKQNLDVLLHLAVCALLHELLDALTVEEKEAADAAGQDAGDPFLRSVDEVR